jgi:hypothetical protein
MGVSSGLIGPIGAMVGRNGCRCQPSVAAPETALRHAACRLETASPILSALVAVGSPKVTGGIDDLPTGRVAML